ncbi:MAG: response regulator [Planctomycetes bacterium]|nr:response regulator [Planctomycetota bacterium]
MTDKPEDLVQQMENLKKRNSELLQEKADLQMIAHMITSLTPLDNIEEISRQILEFVSGMMGGNNIILYYQMADEWRYTDIRNENRQEVFPSDALVADVIRTGMTQEAGAANVPDSRELGAFNPGYFQQKTGTDQQNTPTMSLAIPLSLQKDDVIGVIKFEDMLVRYANIIPQLEAIGGYLALILKNQISNAALLEKANNELQQQNTELREAHAKLQQLASVLNNTQDFIGVIDMEGKCLYQNPTSLAMLGYDITTKGFLQPEMVHTEEDNAKVINKYIPYAIKHGVWRGENRLRHRDGHIIPVDQVIFPVYDSDDNLFAMGTIMRDISEQKQIEERLRQKEKMEAIGQLAGGVAHDFNNQLGGILGYAELLSSKLEDLKLRHAAERILQAALRAADLTKQLLAFARKGKFLVVPVDIHSIIDEVISLLEHSIDKKIMLRRDFKAEIPMTMGDPTQLQNVFLNLALNARDAMPKGGTLLFSTELVDLDDTAFGFDIPADKYIQICVSDSGEGISPEIKKRIFEPFFTTKGQGKGTGLGLAAAYGTVKNHHGAISVYSEIGHGTTFKIYLPWHCEAELNIEPGTEVPLQAGNARVMVVDDEEIIRELASEMLRSVGYKVTTCSCGKEAISHYQDSWQHINLVILDMIMPDLGGRDVFVEMRKINPHVRALLSSGYSINGEAQEILDEGVLGFIQKPFRMNDICRKVNDTLRMD